jgi:hypothetical protein
VSRAWECHRYRCGNCREHVIFQLGPRFGELCVGIVTDFVAAVARFVSHMSEPALAVIDFVAVNPGVWRVWVSWVRVEVSISEPMPYPNPQAWDPYPTGGFTLTCHMAIHQQSAFIPLTHSFFNISSFSIFPIRSAQFGHTNIRWHCRPNGMLGGCFPASHRQVSSLQLYSFLHVHRGHPDGVGTALASLSQLLQYRMPSTSVITTIIIPKQFGPPLLQMKNNSSTVFISSSSNNLSLVTWRLCLVSYSWDRTKRLDVHRKR